MIGIFCTNGTFPKIGWNALGSGKAIGFGNDARGRIGIFTLVGKDFFIYSRACFFLATARVSCEASSISMSSNYISVTSALTALSAATFLFI